MVLALFFDDIFLVWFLDANIRRNVLVFYVLGLVIRKIHM